MSESSHPGPSKRPPRQSRKGLTSTGARKAASKSDRSRSREFALQGLYQVLVGKNSLDDVDSFTVGQQITVGELFAEGELVDVTGVSKGQGFAGTVKRHNFATGPKTHGSDNYRKPGSIGPGTTPGRVYKGVRMGGHMGSERVTIKKVRVVRVDAERNLILVKGSVPGAPGALTFVRKA